MFSQVVLVTVLVRLFGLVQGEGECCVTAVLIDTHIIYLH